MCYTNDIALFEIKLRILRFLTVTRCSLPLSEEGAGAASSRGCVRAVVCRERLDELVEE